MWRRLSLLLTIILFTCCFWGWWHWHSLSSYRIRFKTLFSSYFKSIFSSWRWKCLLTILPQLLWIRRLIWASLTCECCTIGVTGYLMNLINRLWKIRKHALFSHMIDSLLMCEKSIAVINNFTHPAWHSMFSWWSTSAHRSISSFFTYTLTSSLPLVMSWCTYSFTHTSSSFSTLSTATRKG